MELEAALCSAKRLLEEEEKPITLRNLAEYTKRPCDSIRHYLNKFPCLKRKMGVIQGKAPGRKKSTAS